MRKKTITTTIFTVALLAMTLPATAGVLCGWECVEDECEYTGDSGTGCESTVWGFCLDAYCAAGGNVDKKAKADALEEVQQILKRSSEPDFGRIVEKLEEFYGPSFRISTKDGMIFDAATITGVGLGQTPQERVAQCPNFEAEVSTADD